MSGRNDLSERYFRLSSRGKKSNNDNNLITRKKFFNSDNSLFWDIISLSADFVWKDEEKKASEHGDFENFGETNKFFIRVLFFLLLSKRIHPSIHLRRFDKKTYLQ